MTVACVLRSGGVYTPEWVTKLQQTVASHVAGHSFVCLTDMGVPGTACIRLRHLWPGWWAKLALFEPGLFPGPVLYMDLDTLPVGDLTELASYAGPLALLSDFNLPGLAQSGVMAWTEGELTERLWHAWIKDPAGHMQRYRGDGQWLHAHAGPVDRLQALYPGQIVSFKRHARDAPPEGARLVCAHGRPKFNEPAAGWAYEAWRAA
jgi:hypothetical protein